MWLFRMITQIDCGCRIVAYYVGLPSRRGGFDSHHPLQKSSLWDDFFVSAALASGSYGRPCLAIDVGSIPITRSRNHHFGMIYLYLLPWLVAYMVGPT